MDSREKFLKRIDLERRKCEIYAAVSEQPDMFVENIRSMISCDSVEELDGYLSIVHDRIDEIYKLINYRLQIDSELKELDGLK